MTANPSLMIVMLLIGFALGLLLGRIHLVGVLRHIEATDGLYSSTFFKFRCRTCGRVAVAGVSGSGPLSCCGEPMVTWEGEKRS